VPWSKPWKQCRRRTQVGPGGAAAGAKAGAGVEDGGSVVVGAAGAVAVVEKFTRHQVCSEQQIKEVGLTLLIRAVFGWGGQRHKATNRQAEQASPPNPTKKILT
jgi:hypothetical protein